MFGFIQKFKSTGKGKSRILICDFHVGCQMWQQALLKELGFDPRVLSLSGNKKYLREENGGLLEIERRILTVLHGHWGASWKGWGGI
jgi:hypothetical protein